MQGAPRWATLLAVALAIAACGGADLKRSGESCSASSECDRGLVCDFGREPHVCASTSTQQEDAGPSDDADVVVIDGGPDARLDAPPDGRVIDAPPLDAPVDAAVDALIDAP